MKQPHHFLIIDDDSCSNTICRLFIKKYLNPLDIKEFTRPDDGLAYLKNLVPENVSPTILMLDINMPFMSGWEFLDEMEKLDETILKNIKVFVFSSSVNDRDIDQSKNHRLVTDYLVKPLVKETAEEIFARY